MAESRQDPFAPHGQVPESTENVDLFHSLKKPVKSPRGVLPGRILLTRVSLFPGIVPYYHNVGLLYTLVKKKNWSKKIYMD